MPIHKYKLPIGDWSGDGHGIHEDWFITSKGSPDEIYAAFKKAQELYPELDPTKFCNEYQDFEVPQKVRERLGSLRIAFYDGNEEFGPLEMVQYVVWFINQGDPSVDVAMGENNVREITLGNFIGYGLFGY